MKLLLIHRYLWPDAPPYASMLLTMARRFREEGHQVGVLSTQPSYQRTGAVAARPSVEEVDGIGIRRIGLFPESKDQPFRRLLNALVFLVRIATHLAFNRYDLVTFSTMPPVLLGFVVRWMLVLTRRRGRYLYHCMDIYPELAAEAGLMRRSYWYRMLLRIDTRTCQDSAATVVLSDDMQQTMSRRGVADSQIRVINNFSLSQRGTGRRPHDLPPCSAGEFIVLFAGNLGRFQGLEDVVTVAHALSNKRHIQFWFMGEGAVKASLVEQAGELVGETVHFLAYRTPAEAFDVLELADLALVPLKEKIVRFAFPSKTMTNLAAGCRLLVVAEEDSELATIVLENDLGMCCPQGDTGAIGQAILNEAGRPLGPDTRARLVDYATDHFDVGATLDRWADLIAELSYSTT